MSTVVCQKGKDEQVISTSSTDKSVRKLFTYQTGQALIVLGTLFKHIPPFSESIDKNTGNTLISLGRKLKK